MAQDYFEIDMTNYKERRSARVPEGTYRMKVTDTELTKAKTSGNQMLNMWLEVIDHSDPNVNGAIVIDRLVASSGAAFRVVHFLEAVGINPNIGGKLRLPGRAIVGRTLLCDVSDDDPYEGNVKSKIDEYYVDPNAASEQDRRDAVDDLPTAGMPESVDDTANPADVGDDLPDEDVDDDEAVLEVTPTPPPNPADPDAVAATQARVKAVTSGPISVDPAEVEGL